MAYFEAKGAVVTATVFDMEGSQVYAADFKGGCKSISQVGTESIGTRFRYDKSGGVVSNWEISPDSERSVYTERLGSGKETETAKYIYKYMNLDSIVYSDSSGRVVHVDDFGGQVCINFSQFYVAFLNRYYAATGQGAPYLYDTLIHDEYFPESGKLSLRVVNKPDATIRTSYHKNGNIKSRNECAIENGAACKVDFVNEWFESGKPSVEQGRIGTRVFHRHYFENGKPMTESFYKGTKLDSTYRSWFENGNLNQRIEYKLGIELKIEEWDQSGKKL
ncbi:MAG: hypothetical protein JWO30_3970 [Fibrobacteres bacterium]|nr:hypothetical protein [Fibrobacterota bacterium]